MTTALTYLGWTLVLTIFQVILASATKRRQDGMDWAAGVRDKPAPDYHGIAARMVRAQANLYENLPVFIGAVLLAHVSGRESALTAWGAGLFFWGRVAYIPAYAYGLVPWRTVVWAVSLIGLVLVLISLV